MQALKRCYNKTNSATIQQKIMFKIKNENETKKIIIMKDLVRMGFEPHDPQLDSP